MNSFQDASEINPLNANTLEELCEALDYLDTYGPHDIFYSNDITSLPTFGGREPRDTTDIWSWNEESFLLKEDDGWKVAPRSDYPWVK